MAKARIPITYHPINTNGLKKVSEISSDEKTNGINNTVDIEVPVGIILETSNLMKDVKKSITGDKK